MGTLRILLAIAIIVSHAVVISHSSLFGGGLIDGYSSVRAFFIMSGFYMWMILNEKYVGQNNSYKLFITNRFLRIYPAYWTVLVLTIFCMIIGAVFFKGTPNPIARYLSFGRVFSPFVNGTLIFTNLFIFGQDILTFLGIDFKHGANFVIAHDRDFMQNFILLPQSWALSSELFFYLVVPILVTRNIRLTIGLIILISVVKFCCHLFNYHYLDWKFTPFEFVFFLTGGGSYFIYCKLKKLTLSKKYLIPIWIALLLFTAFYQYLPTDKLKHSLYYILFALALPFIFKLTKNYKWDRYIGELSYPLFLVQFTVFIFLGFTALPGEYLAIVSVICSFFLGIFIYHFVTIPVERIRQKRVSPKKNNDTTMPASWKE